MDKGIHQRIVTGMVLAGVLLSSVAVVTLGAALEADSGSTYANPEAPGATATYRITVVAEQNDTVVRNGLERITLNYGADSDFSGSLNGVTARDVDVTIWGGEEKRSVSVAKISTNSKGSWMTINLRRSYNIEPGEEISIEVTEVDSSEIAIQNPQGPRGFALNVRVLDGQGHGDGPVETRYTLDPNASTTVDTATTTVATSEPTSNASETTTMGGQSSTTMGSTPTTTAASADGTAEEGTETTSATGPGFGIVAAVVALLAATLLATNRS